MPIFSNSLLPIASANGNICIHFLHLITEHIKSLVELKYYACSYRDDQLADADIECIAFQNVHIH